jgi:hypothetical protein
VFRHQQETANHGQKLVRAIKKCRGGRFVFLTRRDVPYTNNGSEGALRNVGDPSAR